MILDKTNFNFLVFGKRYLRVWNFELFNQHTNAPQMEESTDLFGLINEDIVDVVSLEDFPYVFVATAQNNLILLKNYQVVDKIQLIVQQDDTSKSVVRSSNKEGGSAGESDAGIFVVQQASVNCLGKLQKGVLCGFKGVCMTGIYEVTPQDKIKFSGNNVIKDENAYAVHCIHAAKEDMYSVLSVLFMPRQINASAINKLSVQIAEEGKDPLQPQPGASQARLEIYLFDLAVADAITNISQDPFEMLVEKGVHQGTILDMSVKPGRSLLASISQDKTAKFWEFQNEYKEIISHYYHETPNCIDLHPLSIQCAIGFKEG